MVCGMCGLEKRIAHANAPGGASAILSLDGVGSQETMNQAEVLSRSQKAQERTWLLDF
jgi:hypothetical protein